MTLKLLCCSDTHDALPPPLDETGALAWFHAGDLIVLPDAMLQEDPAGLAARAARRDELCRWFAGRRIPVYAVRGNHDVSDDLGFFAATREVTGRVVRAAERLWLAGVGWTGDRPYDSPEDEDLGEVCAQVEEQCRLRVANTDRLILLSHFPPEAGGLPDVGPQARPYQVVNELIASIRPIAVVAGHVHDWFGTQANLAAGCGGVLLCNPGPEGGTLTIEPKTGEVSFKPAG